MALITPSPLIGAISGSIAGATFKLTRNGPLLTSRPRRTTNRSQAMHLSDSRFAALTRAWHALTTNQRRSWSFHALHLSKTNALGIPHPPSGYQTFIAHNTPPYLLGHDLLVIPPSRPPLPPIHSDPLIWEFSAPPYRWYPDIPSPIFPVHLFIQASLPALSVNGPLTSQQLPTDTAPFKRWRHLSIYYVYSGVPIIQYGNDFNAQYGWPQTYQRFAFRAYIWHPTAPRSPYFITPGAVMP